jgi:hypothetical protein
VWGTITLRPAGASEDRNDTIKLVIDWQINLCIPHVTLLVVGNLAFFQMHLGNMGLVVGGAFVVILKHTKWKTYDHTSPDDCG